MPKQKIQWKKFTTKQVKQAIEKQQWVLVKVIEKVNDEFEDHLKNRHVVACLRQFALFEASVTNKEASKAVQDWEIEEFPALVILNDKGMPLDDLWLECYSVDPEDIVEFIANQDLAMEKIDRKRKKTQS